MTVLLLKILFLFPKHLLILLMTYTLPYMYAVILSPSLPLFSIYLRMQPSPLNYFLLKLHRLLFVPWRNIVINLLRLFQDLEFTSMAVPIDPSRTTGTFYLPIEVSNRMILVGCLVTAQPFDALVWVTYLG